MPTITLNKTEFEKLVGEKLKLDELKDRISMLGTDLEGIEGDEIHVEIFPNRPDLLSEQGFARAFASFIGKKTGLREYKFKKSGYDLFVKNPPTQWPYALSFVAKNLTLNEEKVRELIQLQEKIGVTMLRNRKKGGIGLYPLEGLEFPITFERKKPKDIVFRPLEYPDTISAPEILEKHKKGKEYAQIMQGWQTYPLFVDNAGKIMSMPPIINSHELGKIDETTKNIFVECTGNDFRIISKALNIFAASLADMGGDVQTMTIHHEGKTFEFPNMNPEKMKLDLAYVNKMLGLELSEKQVKELLEKMGFGYEKDTVLIPAYRADILHQADFVEDIAIAYGYENFEEIIPNVATIGQEDPLETFLQKIRDILVGAKLVEVKNYHLIQEADVSTKILQKNTAVPLANALGEHNHLRNQLIPSLLKNLTDNQHHEYPQNIFEVGRTFREGKSETGVIERDYLAIALCHDQADFTQIRQILQVLADGLGLEISVKETTNPTYIEGRVANIFVGKKQIGVIGEIHPQVLENFGLVVPVVVLELDVENVFEKIKE